MRSFIQAPNGKIKRGDRVNVQTSRGIRQATVQSLGDRGVSVNVILDGNKGPNIVSLTDLVLCDLTDLR